MNYQASRGIAAIKAAAVAAVIAALFCGESQAAHEMRLHDSKARMGWDRAVEYCRSLDAFMPSLSTMELAFNGAYASRQGMRAYEDETYWTSDELEIDGAYLFDFASGLHNVDHKSAKHRVMCIQSGY